MDKSDSREKCGSPLCINLQVKAKTGTSQQICLVATNPGHNYSDVSVFQSVQKIKFEFYKTVKGADLK